MEQPKKGERLRESPVHRSVPQEQQNGDHRPECSLMFFS